VARNTTRKGISHDLTNTDGKTAATPFTRIPDGLREQISNPQYAQLSFEDRLLLLVDLECNRRLDSRTKRRLKLADFPMQATVEDLDFSPERGLERRLVLELSQCNWVDQALNILVSGATGTGKSFVACSLGTAAIRLGYSVRYFRTARFLLSLTAPARRLVPQFTALSFQNRCVDPG